MIYPPHLSGDMPLKPSGPKPQGLAHHALWGYRLPVILEEGSPGFG